jgi:Ca2+/Na+ antiporter
MSIVWIWFIANLIVDLLALIGVVSGIPPAYLGLTLIGVGNSVGGYCNIGFSLFY